MTSLQYQESKYPNPLQIDFDEDFDPSCFDEMPDQVQMGGFKSNESLLHKERHNNIQDGIIQVLSKYGIIYDSNNHDVDLKRFIQ
jgi:hypothetical protein